MELWENKNFKDTQQIDPSDEFLEKLEEIHSVLTKFDISAKIYRPTSTAFRNLSPHELLA
jgi:hypothetical protein